MKCCDNLYIIWFVPSESAFTHQKQPGRLDELVTLEGRIVEWLPGLRDPRPQREERKKVGNRRFQFLPLVPEQHQRFSLPPAEA